MILEQFDAGAVGSQTVIRAADLFCGAGGTSTGLARACKSLGVELQLVAINHLPLAIETHARNHKQAIHFCTGLDSVNPHDVCPDGIDLLLASPECTHHSNARGGKPVSDQSRASGWHVVRWVEAMRPKAFVLENVPEWQSWGPIGANGLPLKSKKGETFRAFLAALRGLGYQVEVGILVAANYGDPTTRKRLFVMGRLGKQRPEWPAQTHAKVSDQTVLFGGLQPWRTAKEIIDWSLQGESIFERKRPLADSTMRRIAAGLKKFSGGQFILPQQRTQTGDAPIGTVTGSNRFAVAQPFMVTAGGPRGQGRNPKDINQPVPTVLTESKLGVVESFLLSQQSGGAPRAITEPPMTVAGKGAIQKVDPFVIPLNHGGNDERTHDVNAPMPTITTIDAWALIEPFLLQYYGSGSGETPRSVDEPLPTVTTKDRFCLVRPTVTVEGQTYALDIRFRMLTPRELARAMSFDDGYQFAGNRTAQVKQVGNAVPCELAKALCMAAIRPMLQITRRSATRWQSRRGHRMKALTLGTALLAASLLVWALRIYGAGWP